MPYKSFRQGDKWAVHKVDADGKPIGKALGTHPSEEAANQQVKALYANTKESEQIKERDFSSEQRQKLADKGQAMDDGSYPIANASDLSNAIQAFGRAKNPEAVKAHIKKRAKALGLEKSLPDNWKESMTTRTGYFSELVDLHEAEFDSSSFIAKGVTLIRPGFSTNTDKNGRPRYYPVETLKQALSVFEGTRAFANHPRRTDEKELPERDVRDIAGYYQNIKASADGTLKADFHVIGKAQEWLWPLIMETKNKPDLVGLSINALGNTALGEVEGRKSIVIESIVSANSVDVVTSPAAGGGFAGALLMSDGDQFTTDLLAAMPFEQWRESRPDFIERLKREWKTPRSDEALKESKLEVEQLKTKLEEVTEANRVSSSELETFKREKLADRLLTASSLPNPLRSAVKAQLTEAVDEDEMKRILKAEEDKYKLTAKEPITPHTGRTVDAKTVLETRKVKPKVDPLFGISEVIKAQPGENAEEYKERRRLRETQTK